MIRAPFRRNHSAVRSGIWATAQQLSNILFVGAFSVVLARNVSVEQFGIYSYAVSLAGLGMAVGLGGLYGLALREYSLNPDKTAQITTSIIVIREATVVISFVILLTVAKLSTDSTSYFVAVLLALLAMFGRVLDAPELWFQSNLDARTPARIKVLTYLAFFAAKMGVLFITGSIFLLLLLYVLEYLVSSALILVCYRKRMLGRAFVRPNFAIVCGLSRVSMPLLISSIANQLNLRAGVVLVQILLGAQSVALLSAASKVTEVAFALPVAYMTATFPALLRVKAKESGSSNVPDENTEYYRALLQRSFDLALWSGILVAVVLYISSGPVIRLLFGSEFEAAIELLQIQALACPFVFIAAVFSKWILAEDRLWVSVGRHCAGAVINVLLGIILIRQVGVIGAAISSSISLVLASYLACFLTRSTRGVGFMMTKSWLFPLAFLRKKIKKNILPIRKGI